MAESAFIFEYPESPPSDIAPEAAWARMEGENDLWYGRFWSYLRLGPKRSVSLASRGRRNAYPLPSHWMVQAQQNRWRDRAEAFDLAHGIVAPDDEEAAEEYLERVEALATGASLGRATA